MNKFLNSGGFAAAGSSGSRFLMETYELLAWRCRAMGEQVSLLWAEISLLALFDIGLILLLVRTLPLLGGGGSAAALVLAVAVAGLGVSGWELWGKVRRLRVLRRELAAVTFQIEGPEEEW